MMIWFLFSFSSLVRTHAGFWWVENMFKAAVKEKTSTKGVTLLMEHYWDEMSIYYSLSLCPLEKNAQLICYCLMPIFPLVVCFSGFTVNASKIWLLFFFVLSAEVIIRISSAWDNEFGMGNSHECTRLKKAQRNLRCEIVVKR